MKYPTKKLLGLTLVSALALAACSNDIGEPGSRKQANAGIDSVNGQIDADSYGLRNMTETGRPANIRVRDGLYLGQDGFRTGRGDPLPRRLETDDGVSMQVAQQMNLRDFALHLRRLTGLRIDYRDLAVTPDNAQMAQENQTTQPLNQSDSAGAGVPSGSLGREDSPSDHPLDINFRVDYTGPLSGLLDQVASQVGADWEYRGGRVKFLGAQTVTYTVWALPGSSSTNSEIGGDGSSAVFGGSRPATTQRNIESDYWAELEAGLDAIIPQIGSRYAINRSNGTIVLTAFQNVHERVASFVERENARVSRQVGVKVDILAFRSNDSDDRSTSLNVLFQSVSRGLGLEVTTPPNQIDGTGIGTTILENDRGLTENLVGTTAVIRALSRKGKVSLLDSVSVIAMNNAPTPVSIMSERAYIAGTSRTETDSGTSTEVDTGIINNGVNMVVTPRILSSGEVNLNYTLNLTTLTGLETFETESTTVQLPEVETRNFMQSLNMDSGSTMVIAAYDSERNTREAAGPFNPRLWGLGGSDGYSTENTRIMILMTPVVIEKQNSPRLRR